MCDTQNNDELLPKLSTRKKATTKPCVKCKASKPDILVRHVGYCKSCFANVFYNKARGIINNAESPVDGQRPKILVAVSGGGSSQALLKIMSMYHQHRIKGRQQKYDNVEVFHIDESSLFKDAQEAKARDLISKYGFKTITAKLEDVFQETNSDFFTNVSIDDSAIEHKNKYPTSESPEKRSNALTHLFDQIKTYTAKEDMLDSIKAYLIVHAAQQNDCSVIAVGDSATRIAVKTIGYTSQGRGFSLPLDVGVSNRWFEGINIIRPMKDMLGKEVGYFNHCMGIDTAIVPTFTTRAPQKASIDRLTESLIVGLDRDFPSTISTIGRTAGKLEVTRKAIESPQCPLCGMPSEADSIEWRKMLSVSSLGDEEAMQNTTTPLIRAMCYSCQNTMRDVKPDAGLLPSFVNERSQNKAHNSQSLLKKQIESFLID